MLLFSVVNEFVEMLGINHPNILFTFNNDKNGNHRKSPVVIKISSYNKADMVLKRAVEMGNEEWIRVYEKEMLSK